MKAEVPTLHRKVNAAEEAEAKVSEEEAGVRQGVGVENGGSGQSLSLFETCSGRPSRA